MTAKTLLVLTRDLFFQSKIRAAVQNLPPESDGSHWQGIYVRSEADFEGRLADASPELVLLDLQADQVDVFNLIGSARANKVPVLAFGRHTDPQSLRKARQTGAVRAVPNSTLVNKFAYLVEFATNPVAVPVPVEADLED